MNRRAFAGVFVYWLRMGVQPVAAALRCVRRLRRGSINATDAVPEIRPFLAAGLGHTCDVFASWIARSTANGRAADAAIRFFGLDQLPEDLDRIGATMRARRDRGSPLESPLGISARQVQKLITEAIGDLVDYPPPPVPTNAINPTVLADPFPGPIDHADLRNIERILWWAWAQVPDGDRPAAAALLLYEQEHGLRDRVVTPTSRMERLRLRRLAWSVLEVARYRADLARDGGAVLDRCLGRPYVVRIDADPSSNGEQLAALVSLTGNGATVSLDAVTTSMDLVRAAVRTARPEAAELLGVLGDALRRYRRTTGSEPMEIVSKQFALSTILAREQRDIAGLARGYAGLRLIDRWLESPAGWRNPARRSLVISDSLRINQELAELYDTLGSYEAAWRMLGELRSRLARLGDPEQDSEPNGWLQQLRLTESSVARHLAGRRQSQRWLEQAGCCADEAAALALDTASLPLAWGIAAAGQRIGVSLDRFEWSTDSPDAPAPDIERRLAELDRHAEQLPRGTARTDLSTILGIKLTTWRAALLRHDRPGIVAAQKSVLSLVDSRTLPRELDEIENYVRRGRRLGICHDPAPIIGPLRRRVLDRIRIRSVPTA